MIPLTEPGGEFSFRVYTPGRIRVRTVRVLRLSGLEMLVRDVDNGVLSYLQAEVVR